MFQFGALCEGTNPLTRRSVVARERKTPAVEGRGLDHGRVVLKLSLTVCRGVQDRKHGLLRGGTQQVERSSCRLTPREGAKFWLKVMNELKTRGLNDIPDEVRYIQRRAADHDGRVVTVCPL